MQHQFSICVIECGSVNCFIIVGEFSTVATLTATKDSEETILALLLWEVNHRIFGPGRKNYRQMSLHAAGDGSSVVGMEAVNFFVCLYVQFMITHSHVIRFM